LGGGEVIEGDAQSGGAAESTGLGTVGDDDERGIAFAGQLGEPDAVDARQQRRAVEHHQSKNPAAEQQVGRPGAAGSVARADHDQSATQIGPGLRGQRAACVDPGHPSAAGQHALYDPPEQGGFAGTADANDFGDAPSRNPTAQRDVERPDAGRHGRAGWLVADHHVVHLRPELLEGARRGGEVGLVERGRREGDGSGSGSWHWCGSSGLPNKYRRFGIPLGVDRGREAGRHWRS